MDGWTIFAWGATCAVGVLLFLGCAAHHVRRTDFAMDQLERRRRRAAERAHAAGPTLDAVGR